MSIFVCMCLSEKRDVDLNEYKEGHQYVYLRICSKKHLEQNKRGRDNNDYSLSWTIID